MVTNQERKRHFRSILKCVKVRLAQELERVWVLSSLRGATRHWCLPSAFLSPTLGVAEETQVSPMERTCRGAQGCSRGRRKKRGEKRGEKEANAQGEKKQESPRNQPVSPLFLPLLFCAARFLLSLRPSASFLVLRPGANLSRGKERPFSLSEKRRMEDFGSAPRFFPARACVLLGFPDGKRFMDEIGACVF